jgi:hypothetical protein
MVNRGILGTLEQLKAEMGRACRSEEESALRDALRALRRSNREFLTAGQAAERLSVSPASIKRWAQRGALVGGTVGSAWLVSAESVEALARLRSSLAEMDHEGNPSADEIRAHYNLGSRPAPQ